MENLSSSKNLIFFLGGHDLEMLTIRELLEARVSGRFFDKELSWGAKTSDYEEEIRECLKKGLIPVLVELRQNLELDPNAVILVDHHGDRAGENEPTSLHQVFQLQKLPPEKWTRWMELVAANDRGYIPGMKKAGANQEEIEKVRSADRAAQGITPEQEAEGQRAAAMAETFAHGKLTVARINHNKTATVADRLDSSLAGPGYQNLLIISPGEVNFFGSGMLIHKLKEKFPGGWYGGALPNRGFWGRRAPVPDLESFLLDKIREGMGISTLSV